MVKRNFGFDKDWFVFPLTVIVHTKCMEYICPANRVEIHFLWWHWAWTFIRERR